MALKKCECALCDHARMREDICGIYCVGGFWKQPDGSCDHYVDYLEKRRSDPAPAGPTNADRIRAMRDEELAEFAIMSSKFFCTKKHDEVCEKPMGCTECAFNWLQQPAPKEEQDV